MLYKIVPQTLLSGNKKTWPEKLLEYKCFFFSLNADVFFFTQRKFFLFFTRCKSFFFPQNEHFFFLVQIYVKNGLKMKKNVDLVQGEEKNQKLIYVTELMEDQSSLERHFFFNQFNLNIKKKRGVIRYVVTK